MITKFSKWMIYISSYLILYFLLIIKILTSTVNGSQSFKKIISTNFLPLIGLCVLFFLSFLWVGHMKTWRNNTRLKEKVQKNSTIDMVGFIVPYIFSLITIDIDKFGIIINIICFLVLGLAFVNSEKIFLSPTFLLMGYKLYESDSKLIFSRWSMDKLNIQIDENSDGIEVRGLCKNIYLHIN